MVDADENPNSNVIALLCVGDVVELNDGSLSPLTSCFGQPLIHHMIKSLERAGISKFCIGVDIVPGALLQYRDQAVSAGLDIQFVRNTSAIAEHYGQDTRILVLQADTLWNPELVLDFLRRSQAVIATVEERPENQLFERIDLNNRWGGLAVLNASTLGALTDLPEGWDVSSALLRQAIQDAVPMVPVKQSALQDGGVRKLAQVADVGAVQGVLNVAGQRGANNLETTVFSYPVDRLLPRIWTVSWGRQLVEWSPPLFAAIALLMSATGFPQIAIFVSILSIFTAFVRRETQAAEYRSGRPDGAEIASWSILAATLFFILAAVLPDMVDAVFLTAMLVGLAVLAQKRAGDQFGHKAFAFLTPLSIAVGLCVGAVLGVSAFAAKFLIVAETANQIRLAFWPFAKKTSDD